MNLLSKRIQYISAILVIVGALLKISHLHPSGSYLIAGGFFLYGIAGILEFSFSSTRAFHSYAKLVASVLICLAVTADLIFGTKSIYIALIFLGVSLVSSVLPQRKIPK